MQIQKLAPTLNNSNYTVRNNYNFNTNYSINFAAEPIKPKSKFFEAVTKPFKSFYNDLTNGIGDVIAKLIHTKPVEKLVEMTKKSKFFSKYQVPNTTALTSIVLSGFYMQQTLRNKKLDEKRRKTLAINQGSTCVLSTVLAYTFNKLADKKVNEFTNKFLAVNFKKEAGNAEVLKRFGDGIGAAASIVIFMTVYRFLAPVLITPIANKIGDKLDEKKQAELAASNAVNVEREANK